MLKKNSIPAGVLVALVFPAIALVVDNVLKNNIYILNKPALPYFVAAFLNIVLIRLCVRNGLDKTNQGIILVTLTVMVLTFIFKIRL